MWSFVQRKAHQRWLWHAIDHLSGVVLAYAFGSRADAVFVELKKLLKPFGLVHFYTDGAGVYERHLPASAHTVGKSNTQQIERKHLTLRTRVKRLVRKTICFSKSVQMHDLLIGLFINRFEFGLSNPRRINCIGTVPSRASMPTAFKSSSTTSRPTMRTALISLSWITERAIWLGGYTYPPISGSCRCPLTARNLIPSSGSGAISKITSPFPCTKDSRR